MTIVEEFTHEEITGFKFGKLPFGRPKMFSIIYFIDGLLIDTGHSQMRKHILKKVYQLDVQQIFITHHHEDHSGNVKLIQEKFGCDIYASKLCCETMKNPPKICFVQKVLWGDRPTQHNMIPKDDTIQTKQFEFQIIPIPGHAADMVALYEPHRKWLFSADLYLNHYIGYYLYSESMATQIKSIKTVLELDFNVMLCNHNPQFKEPKTKLIKKLDFLEHFYDSVAQLHQKGCSPDEIFKRLKFKEHRFIKFFSGGDLSRMNMIRSVIRDINNETVMG